MKYKLLLIFLVVRISCYAQIPSVAGVTLGDSYEKVESILDERFGKYNKTSDPVEITYYDVEVGGINYKFGAFAFIHVGGKKVLNQVRLYQNYSLNELNKAKSKRDYIASVYKKKYDDMKERKDPDGFKFYVCCLNLYRDMYMIVIDLMKSKSDSGKLQYYVTTCYGPLYTESTDDI